MDFIVLIKILKTVHRNYQRKIKLKINRYSLTRHVISAQKTENALLGQKIC